MNVIDAHLVRDGKSSQCSVFLVSTIEPAGRQQSVSLFQCLSMNMPPLNDRLVLLRTH